MKLNLTLNYQKIFTLIIAFLMIFYGCKKEIVPSSLQKEKQVENAKNWYQKQAENKELFIKSSDNQSIPLKFELNWEKANAVDINGISVISIPIQTNLSKIFGDQTEFNILIMNENLNYSGKIVATKALQLNQDKKNDVLSIEQLYNSAFTQKDLTSEITDNVEIKVFTLGLKNEQTTYYTNSGKQVVVSKNEPQPFGTKNLKLLSFGKVSSNGNAVSNAPIPVEGCTYYFLCTTEFDSEGYIIDYYETYLGRICQSDVGGGGGSTTVPPLPDVKNQVADTCLKKRVDSALAVNIENKISLMIDSVFGVSRSVNLIIKDVTTLASSDDAETGYSVTNGVFTGAEISLNRTVLVGASKEYITVIMLHEALHAYMAKDGVILDASHELMATKYLSVMTNILKSTYPSMTTSHARSLSWVGLQGTPFYSDPPAGMPLPLNQYSVSNKYRVAELGSPGCPNGLIE